MRDTPRRSLVKTVSWRLTGSSATFVISYLISGNFAIAGSIALAQITANTILYYLHERVWIRVKWGASMILPDFILYSRINQHWHYTGIDSYDECSDKKHFKSYPYNIDYVYNSRGYRDQEWPDTLEELRESVWCIGDSFTVGLGSPLEHTWPYCVNQQLNKRTINISMDGASNYWIVRKAVDIINKIKPKLIIVQWSYINRAELNDSTLSDEARRQHFLDISLNDIELGNNFVKLVQKLESTKQNTGIIHSFIPDFGIANNIQETWGQIAGPDWPAVPATLDEFNNLGVGVVDELTNNFKLYDMFNLYYRLFHNIKYVPEIHPIDLARDGHHYDILTAKKFAISVSELLLDRRVQF
jgi:uncharacterized membrane protein